MNRYQLEVAEMDRRQRLTIRTLSLLGAASLVMVALWSAGLPPGEWWTRTQSWFAGLDKPSQQFASAPTPQVPASAALPTIAPPLTADLLPGTDSSISPTPQPLLLVSTSPGRNKSEGTARIGTNPDNPQTYVGGAILANGARLAEIHSDRIILTRDGKELAIYISTDKHAATKRSKGFGDLAMVGGLRETAPNVVALAEDHLTDVVRSMPLYENDLLAGMQVFPGQKSAAFSQLGLRSGDVIVALESAPVADPTSATQILRTLTEGVAMTVTVRRGNETKTISLDGSIVAKAVAKPDPATQPGMMAGPPPL